MPSTADLLSLDPALLRHPWPLYEQWRSRGPIAPLEELDGWVVTDAALAKAILLDSDAWSSDSVNGPLPAAHDDWLEELSREDDELRELLSVPLQTLLGTDPPAHGRLRRILTPWFSAASISRLEPLVGGLAGELLAPLVSGEPVELVAAYARVLPLRTVATLLGLPRERWDEFAALAAGASTSNPHLETKETLRERLHAELELLRYFDERLDDATVTADPHGLIGGLRAAVGAGQITRREATGLCREILVAGAESTSAHISSAVVLLARDEGLPPRLAADREALPVFVEEALRLEPAFTGFWRRARRPLEVGGVDLPEGALLLVPFAALNRDPAAFARPGELDLGRPAPRRHLSFGHGIHFCIGAPLVRLQSLSTFGRLVGAAERVELLIDESELEYEASIQDRALRRVPVRLVPRAA